MTRIPGQSIDLRVGDGSPVPRGSRRPPSADTLAIPLIDELPTYGVVRGYFREIASEAAAPGNTLAAWYGLQRFQIDEDSGQELAMLAAWADLRPCDTSAGATSPSGGIVKAWGNAAGDACHIVVGIDLPITMNAWTYAAAHLPGTSSVAPGLLNGQGFSPYLWSTTFPPGAYTDTIPQRNIPAVSTAPLVARLTRGHTLDIALVMHETYLAAAGVFVGFADVSVIVGRRRAKEAFQE